MGTSTLTTNTTAASTAAQYLTQAVRLSYETLMPDDQNEAAAFAEWATAGEGLPRKRACEEIAVALASVRILLTREISDEARAKLEHDREVLQFRGVRLAHNGIERRIASMADDEFVKPWEVENRIDKAKAGAFRRFDRTDNPDIRLELVGHKMALDELELETRAL